MGDQAAAVTDPKAAGSATASGTEDITKLKETVTTLQQTNNQILSAIKEMQKVATKPAPKAQPTPEKKTNLKDVWFDDQEAAAAIIEERAERRIQQRMEQAQKQQNQTNNVMRTLYKDFPELQDMDHPLTQKAIELFEKMSDEEKQSPLAYKVAVRDAAEELEIKPKAKRKEKVDDDDSFSLGGGNTRSAPEGTRQSGGKRPARLDPRTVEFARQMGLDMDDPKVVESLTETAQRNDWLTYRAPRRPTPRKG